MHYYNSFDQLIRRMVLVTTSANTYYTYNAQGIRTAKKTPDGLRTAFLLDGGNVVGEVQNNAVTQNYLRGINLIRREAGTSTDYYLFNAHGDVVNLVNTAGVVTQSYDYDAFGVEKDPDPLDTNHFRYCGEYLDAEAGRYYLRARYYDPLIGRFTQRDTHWNTANMIYGDNPQKINEREDKLGLKTYSYAPQISAIVQSGNLYVYGINNPVQYCDDSGKSIVLSLIIGGVVGATISGAITVVRNIRNEKEWHDGLAMSMLAGGIGGVISCVPIPGVNAFVSAAITGAAGNVATQAILGEIKSIDDLSSAVLFGAGAGLLGAGAAKLLNDVLTKHFSSLSKSAQKEFLKRIGTVTNRQLTEIRQVVKSGLTPQILDDLVKKYGYDVLVSASVSTTATSIK